MINQVQEIRCRAGRRSEQPSREDAQGIRRDRPRSRGRVCLGPQGAEVPVRTLARSGIKITNVSQTAVASLIELQSDMLTSAISDAALRLERASRADNIVELVREQVEMIPATRDRIVEDAQRAA